MVYRALLRDSVIITDDYAENEFFTLVKNLKLDFVKFGIDYPVPIVDEQNRFVMCICPEDAKRA